VPLSAAHNTPPEIPVGPPPSTVETSPHLVGDEPAIVALVERAGQRDRAAFAELYDQFLGPVYRYAFYRVGTRADAEDLSEQVFLQAWAAIDRFRWQGKPFLAWLYALAHNLVIDWRRRAKPAQSLDDGEHPLDPESPSAAQAMTQWLDAELLAAAMARITPEQEQVIRLKFMEGFDTSQVARLMDKREGTIRALQFRALRSLRRELEEQGERGST
jgi:RNA polymerase sigma-70 factor (ECF subfamily)